MASSTYGTMYYVDRMSQAVAFYQKLLRKKPRYQSKEWTEFDVGGHAICLHAKERGKRYRSNGILIIRRSGIRSLFKTMKRKKLKVSGLHEVHPSAWTFALSDSSKNELSFYGKP